MKFELAAVEITTRGKGTYKIDSNVDRTDYRLGCKHENLLCSVTDPGVILQCIIIVEQEPMFHGSGIHDVRS